MIIFTQGLMRFQTQLTGWVWTGGNGLRMDSGDRLRGPLIGCGWWERRKEALMTSGLGGRNGGPWTGWGEARLVAELWEADGINGWLLIFVVCVLLTFDFIPNSLDCTPGGCIEQPIPSRFSQVLSWVARDLLKIMKVIQVFPDLPRMG